MAHLKWLTVNSKKIGGFFLGFTTMTIILAKIGKVEGLFTLQFARLRCFHAHSMQYARHRGHFVARCLGCPGLLTETCLIPSIAGRNEIDHNVGFVDRYSFSLLIIMGAMKYTPYPRGPITSSVLVG